MARQLWLAAVGDIQLDHDFSPKKGSHRRTFEILSRSDLVFANLETPMGTQGNPREKMFTYRANPSVARVLVSAGVDIVTLANNHMFDYGDQAFKQTLATLSSVEIPCVGAGMDIAKACKPVILESRGVRIAFMGLAATLPLGAAASPKRPGLAPVHVSTSYEVDPTLLQEQPGTPPKIRTQVNIHDQRRICADIKRAKADADHVIVGIHWGVGYQREKVEYQAPLGRKMIEAGASLIVGHHPHVRQGVERYQEGIILYSLGDFVFQDRVDIPIESGMMATVEFGLRKVKSLRLWPINVDPVTGTPILATSRDAKKLLTEMVEYNPAESYRRDGNAVRVHL